MIKLIVEKLFSDERKIITSLNKEKKKERNNERKLIINSVQ